MNTPMLQNPQGLEQLQTGNVRLPQWAFAKEVDAWTRLLTERDLRRAGFVKMHEGFTETAYRYVFPHKEQYKEKSAKLQNLITILPSAKRENDERLLHNAEAGLIAYTKKQSMEADLAKKQFDVDPFVWARGDGTFAVVQTWPVEINDCFREKFEVVTTPEKQFEQTALDEFKMSMQKLFELPAHTELSVMSVKKTTNNCKPLYVGTGRALMAMLRVSKKVRVALDITSMVDPDGLRCRWTCEDRSGEHVFPLDLTLEYCLYMKDGWDTMACVKPKTQFDWDCEAHGEGGKHFDMGNTQDTLPYMMDLDWFASEAYSWTMKSAVVVWTCAVLTVLLRWRGSALGWDWVNNPVVLAVVTGIASTFALYADFQAMKWCIVPWLQKVRKLVIMLCPLPFRLFLLVQLLGTFLQVLTIQNNAWFMVTAVQENDNLLHLWVYLWKPSMFGYFLPIITWKKWITPQWTAIFLWFLSTIQLTLPLMTSVRWPERSKTLPFPTKNADDYRVNDLGELEKMGRAFVPESYYYDFRTSWTKLVEGALEVWGFPAIRCTYRESVANLALASGLRYTGSMSLSYPRQRINEIIEFKEGYTVHTKEGLEPLPQGWEMRSLKEFQKLARTQRNRVSFIMLCKLALQVNLQITFIILMRIQKKQFTESVFGGNLTSMNVVGMISIASLAFTFGVELLDVMDITRTFFRVNSAVRGTAFKVGASSKVYAQDDWIESEDASHQSVIHSGKDLKAEYYVAVRYFVTIMAITIFSSWLIGYALLKFFCAERCEDGAWEFWSGCLPPIGKAADGPTTYCCEGIFC